MPIMGMEEVNLMNSRWGYLWRRGWKKEWAYVVYSITKILDRGKEETTG